jgi:beta-lactamase regulating signal transducer with metallopeptidase domain
MHSLSVIAVSYLLNSLWEVTLIGCAGMIAARLFRGIGAQAQHRICVATLILSSLAPAVPLFRPVLSQIAGLTASGTTGHVTMPVTLLSEEANDSVSSDALVLPQAVIFTLAVLYLTAMLFCAIRLGFSLRQTIGIAGDAHEMALSEETEAIWEKCRKAFSVGSAKIQASKCVAGPVTMGFSRPMLLMPEGFTEQCAPQDLLTALAHECAHIQRRDFLKNLLYEFASLPIAFHPVAWIVKSQIAQTREMICDAMATEQLVESHAYSQSLLRLASIICCNLRPATSHAIGIFDANILEKRIMTVRKNRLHASVTSRVALTITATLILLAATLTGPVLALQVAPQTPGNSPNTANLPKPDHNKDHICTYYDDRDNAYPGHCGTSKHDKKTWYCIADQNKTWFEHQIGCDNSLSKK